MAALNRGLLSESFFATQTRVQVVCVIVTYTNIWAQAALGRGPQCKLEETEPRSGLGFKVFNLMWYVLFIIFTVVSSC
jgi:hypothetical protein